MIVVYSDAIEVRDSRHPERDLNLYWDENEWKYDPSVVFTILIAAAQVENPAKIQFVEDDD